MSTSSKLMPRPSVLPSNYNRIQTLESTHAPPDNELSIFKVAREILSSVKPGSDVTNINLPASVLDPESTLEKAKKSMQRGELLQDICNPENDPITRFINVIRFNMSGLTREKFGKKPYNPILGEIYRCAFVHRDNGGVTLLLAEQVSHHPPVTALHLRNETLGFSMNSHTTPEPKFWGNSIEVKLPGTIRINLKHFNDNEEYVITRPYLYMTGFIAGKQRLEFHGISTFQCLKTNLGAEIEYKAKSSMSYRNDGLNGVVGRIFELNSDKTLYTLDGHWDKMITMTNVQTGEQSSLFDYDSIEAEKSMVALLPPENELEESFSTEVWKNCSKAILQGETLVANAEKRKVEEHQRKLRKEREAAKIEWQHHYFTEVKKGQGDNDVDVNSSEIQAYDLREDLKSQQEKLVHVAVTEEEMKGLKDGKIVRQMMEKNASNDEANGLGNGEGLRKKLFGKRNLLNRTG